MNQQARLMLYGISTGKNSATASVCNNAANSAVTRDPATLALILFHVKHMQVPDGKEHVLSPNTTKANRSLPSGQPRFT